MKKYILLLVFLLIYGKTYCQEFNVTNTLQFATYLTKKKLFKEAVYVLESQKKLDTKPPFLDSIYYLLGDNYTWLTEYEQANCYYSFVSGISPTLSTFGMFKIGNNFVKLKKYDSASSYFNSIEDTTLDTSLVDLKYFSLTSSALLKRDFVSYLFYSKKLNTPNDLLNPAINNNTLLYNKMIHYKKKSPFLAGLFSAIVPGAGKLYAGKKGEALGAFLPMAALGLLAIESYNNGGPKKLPFIGFTTLFSVFYIGNIWGSVMSVNINKTEFNKAINNEITINMQLPFDSLLH